MYELKGTENWYKQFENVEVNSSCVIYFSGDMLKFLFEVF